jgi:hypothetical protein
VILAAALLFEVAYSVPKLLDHSLLYGVGNGVRLVVLFCQVDVHPSVFGAFVLYGAPTYPLTSKTRQGEGLAGARVTTFYYRDITGVEANTGLLQGVIEVNTPAFPGTTTKDYWSQGRDRNPRFASNCVPIDRPGLKAYKPYLDQLRHWIQETKQEGRGPRPASLSDELQKLAALKEQGVLTDEEVEQAKARILGG